MPDEPDVTGGRQYSVGSGLQLEMGELKSASKGVGDLADALKKLQGTFSSFSSASSQGVTNMLKGLREEADKAKASLDGLSSSLGGVGGGGGGRTPGPGVVGGGGYGGWQNDANQQANAAVSATGGGGQGVSKYLAPTLGAATNFLTSAALSPIRFLRDRVNTNRQTSIMATGALSMMGRQQGIGYGGSMGWGQALGQMAQFPGGLMGSPDELIDLFAGLPQLGASYNFGRGAGMNGPRASGMFRGLQQMQTLNPMASVTQLAGTLGGQAANVQSQQAGAFYTGGAFAMIKSGGGQKSLSEWAEGILKWFQNMRGGNQRGKAFSYGELLAQQFPGSNINAWFNVNGVSQDMQNYWWTYVLGKLQSGQPADREWNITPDISSTAYQRLRAGSELTRTEFGLAGAMTGAYANREQSNRWFNQFFGQMQQQLIPALAASNAGQWIQYLPDTVEDLLMGVTEWGVSALGKGANAAIGGVGGGGGDIGDAGGYGDWGGNGTAGMSLNMRAKLGPMLAANPRLRVKSGLRDTEMQKRLRAKGYNKVSGKPSAHTRGDAADLGPPSQYGWIAANAGRFGLKSGRSQGEPWHVGVGDVDGVGDSLSDVFGSNPLMQLLGGAAGLGGSILNTIFGGLFDTFGTGREAVGKASSSVASIFGTFLASLIGSDPSKADLSKIAFQPDVFDTMVNASKGTKVGIMDLKGISGGGLLDTLTGGLTRILAGGAAGAAGLPTAGGTGGGAFTPEYSAGFTPGRGGPMSWEDVTKAAYGAGFRGTGLQTAVAITQGESGRDPTAHGDQAKADAKWGHSIGLWQVRSLNADMNTGRIRDASRLEDPTFNAQSAFALSHNTKFSDWTVYNKGGHKQYMDEALAAMHATGLGDTAESAMAYQSMVSSAPASGAMTFNNTFNFSGGSSGGGGGIDVRRAVTQIADQLETEMSRRLARAS